MTEENVPQDAIALNLPAEALEFAEAAAVEAEASASNCACTLFAVVNPNGTLARGFRAVSSQRLGVGTYQVVFNRDVRACAYVATVGLSGAAGASPSGEITVVGRNGNANAVFIQTFASGGALADRGFHLAVHCRP